MAESDQFENWLEAQLQTNTYLDDDGFTDKVMLALPERHVDRPVFVWLQLLAVLAGCVIVAWKLPVLGFFFDVLASFDQNWLLIATVAALLGTMTAIGYSVKRRLI